MTDADMDDFSRIAKKYDALAKNYDTRPDLGNAPLRRSILSMAAGRVLEVGIGTGINLAHYPKQFREQALGVSYGERGLNGTAASNTIVGIDASPQMLAIARVKAHLLGIRFEGITMDACRLEFNDGTFDTIVSTFSACVFADALQAFKEMKRVCKEQGKLLLVEHSRTRALGVVLDLLTPITVRLWGCHLNRDIVAAISEAGLRIVSERTGRMGFVRGLELSPSLERSHNAVL